MLFSRRTESIMTNDTFGIEKGGTLSGLKAIFTTEPQGCRSRSNPGLQLANAFGVKGER